MDGQLQYFNETGQLMVLSTGAGAGHLAASCCCQAACQCGPGQGVCYRIAEYEDGDIQSCPGCADAVPADRVWDGRFLANDWCSWEKWFDYDVRMAGKKLHSVHLRHISTRPCRWEALIQCIQYGMGPVTVWRGTKTTGNTPAGTYEKEEGCSELETLTLVPCE
jgi:hypothetical protein